MKPFFTSLAAVAIATAPIAASAVSISNIDGPNDYHSVNLSQTTTLPALASWTAAPTTRSGNSSGLYRSPFDETTSDTIENGSIAIPEALEYFAVGPDNPQNPSILEFSRNQSSLSFLWGSPDTYNSLTFYLDGAQVGGPFNQTDLDPPLTPTSPQSSNVYVTFNGEFDEVQFESSPNNAFEFSNISSTPVPAPAGMALLGGGLLAMGLMRRRR